MTYLRRDPVPESLPQSCRRVPTLRLGNRSNLGPLDGAPPLPAHARQDWRGCMEVICLSIPANEPQNPGEDDSPNHGNEDADDQSVLAHSAETQVTGKKTADQGANQPNDHVHEEAISRALHDLA